jgi:hypothetical protein
MVHYHVHKSTVKSILILYVNVHLGFANSEIVTWDLYFDEKCNIYCSQHPFPTALLKAIGVRASRSKVSSITCVRTKFTNI